MSTPNYAYFFGQTPAAGGGTGAFMHALNSGLLGVNTTIATAIAVTGSQAVTPASMVNIQVGSALWVNWGASDQECVSVTAVTATTFTASFTKTHSGGASVGVGINYQCGATNPWTMPAYQGPNTTTVAAGSNGAALPQATINVASTAGFYSFGGLLSIQSSFGTQFVNYSGVSGNAFTSCLGGAGTLSTGGTVSNAVVYTSAAASPSGDSNYAVLIFMSSGANNIGACTATDIDNSSSKSAPQGAANFYSAGPYPGQTVTLQDAQFSWWAVVCEYGVVAVMNIGGAYHSFSAQSLRTAWPTTMRGVGAATTAIVAAATSVTVSPDISSRITVGQKVYITNQSHSSASANWTAATVMMTVSAVTGNGTTATLTFSDVGGVPHAFDSGALVGLVPPSACVNLNSTQLDSSSWYLNKYLNGSYTGYNSQTGTPAYLVIASQFNSYVSPSAAPIPVYAGELDLPILDFTGGKYGVDGFIYGIQEFTLTGIAQADYFYDPSNLFTWKAFLGGNSWGMGPLVNAQNMTAAPTAWTP